MLILRLEGNPSEREKKKPTKNFSVILISSVIIVLVARYTMIALTLSSLCVVGYLDDCMVHAIKVWAFSCAFYSFKKRSYL
jgi:hypothetical protein